ncbi:hypothetical protein EWM64_g742 [Hericium alpestre]|uniref:non-specific serine/threonine protein kinase n=1 Tax=Hericium alpestre TaxID=135208 RepID=A0A4Z0AAA4_9AGAM|nr:hypothetical protein EWM64_g742 [Hericium alpestre]
MFLQHRLFASLKEADSVARGRRGGPTVIANHTAPPVRKEELSKMTTVVKREAVPLGDPQEEERKHLQALYDAVHEPDLLDIHRRIKLPTHPANLLDIVCSAFPINSMVRLLIHLGSQHFDDPKDLVRFSKTLPDVQPVQYGQPPSAAVAESLGLALAAPPKVGLQDFTAIKKLGSGRSGIVYLVKHQPTQKLFALKTMAKESLDGDAICLLVQEQRMLRKVCGHRNVVGLEASFHDQENFFLVTPFMAGGDMRAELQWCRKFQTGRATFYAAQIILALEFIHSMHIIHCDIKPENLLLDAAGNLRVCNFGSSKQFETVRVDSKHKPNPFWAALSRARRSDASQGSAKKPRLTPWRHGTPAYSAPEVFQGKPYGCEVDFWALGVVVYEMATGRTPFKDSADPGEVYRSVARDEVSFQARDHAELWVQVFIIQLLWKNPTDRLAPGTIRDHQFFRTINWARLAGVDDAEHNNGYLKTTSAGSVVPDPFPRYTFQSEIFARILPAEPSPSKSSGTGTASESPIATSVPAFRGPEPALPQFPSYLFEFRKFSAAFAAMSPSLSSGSLRRPLSDASSSSSASGSSSSLCYKSPDLAQSPVLPSSGHFPAPRKSFADVRRWARKLRA